MSATCCLFLSLLGQNIFRPIGDTKEHGTFSDYGGSRPDPIGDKAARMLKTVKKSTKMFLFLFF